MHAHICAHACVHVYICIVDLAYDLNCEGELLRILVNSVIVIHV